MDHRYGYNCKEGGSRGCLSEESKKKISEAQETRAVEQYNLRGELVKVWDSIKDAEKELGISSSNICNCCKGIRNTAGDYIWRYHGENCSRYNPIEISKTIKEDLDAITQKKRSDARKGTHLSEETKKKISEANSGEKHHFYGKHHSEESLKKMSKSHKGQHMGINHHNARKVSQYDKQGSLIKIWDCMKDASRELGIDYRNIYSCCKNERKIAGGFIWRYYKDKLTKEHIDWCNDGKRGRPVAQYSLSGELICVFENVNMAVAETGIYRNGIYRCCNKERNKAGGYIWKYYEE